MEHTFKDEPTTSDLSNGKKAWVTPELLFLPMDIINGDSWPGNDGGGIYTSS